MNFYDYENLPTDQLHARLQGIDLTNLTMQDLRLAVTMLCRRVMDIEGAVTREADHE